eukprot:1195200-Prorocentrum_minimum.AAC.4
MHSTPTAPLPLFSPLCPVPNFLPLLSPLALLASPLALLGGGEGFTVKRRLPTTRVRARLPGGLFVRKPPHHRQPVVVRVLLHVNLQFQAAMLQGGMLLVGWAALQAGGHHVRVAVDGRVPALPHPRGAAPDLCKPDADTVKWTVKTLSSHLVTLEGVRFSRRFFTDVACPCRALPTCPHPIPRGRNRQCSRYKQYSTLSTAQSVQYRQYLCGVERVRLKVEGLRVGHGRISRYGAAGPRHLRKGDPRPITGGERGYTRGAIQSQEGRAHIIPAGRRPSCRAACPRRAPGA